MGALVEKHVALGRLTAFELLPMWALMPSSTDCSTAGAPRDSMGPLLDCASGGAAEYLPSSSDVQWQRNDPKAAANTIVLATRESFGTLRLWKLFLTLQVVNRSHDVNKILDKCACSKALNPITYIQNLRPSASKSLYDRRGIGACFTIGSVLRHEIEAPF